MALALLSISLSLTLFFGEAKAHAAGGVLVVATEDETQGQPVVARMELYRAPVATKPGASKPGSPQIVRKAASAGRGVVVSESLELALPDGGYQFRFVRGPEYRIIAGNFVLERTSQDQRTIELPRMVEMKKEGWLSCDFAVPAETENLHLRMAAEDLHFAATIGTASPPKMPHVQPENRSPYEPIWVTENVVMTNDRNVLCYPASCLRTPQEIATEHQSVTAIPGETAAQTIARVTEDDAVRIAIANPFAWSLPVWLATGEIDGMFVLGDWLREDKRVEKVADARPPSGIGFTGPRGLGRYAEFIYWQLLETGFRIAPLAGTGTDKSLTQSSPVGYNRVYVTERSNTDYGTAETSGTLQIPKSPEECFASAWAGSSVITNGPMLRPTLGGFAPGHLFEAVSGEALLLGMELNLSVRDEVDYLEIVHNGRVFHSARLHEFAAAGGQLPELKIEESGWAVVRVVTQHEDHFRMATSAPWYFEFDKRPRISRNAVKFFGEWLTDCESKLKQLPAPELAKHVPFVVTARRFWGQKLDDATVD